MTDGPTIGPKTTPYQAEVAADIANCVQTMGCQPILFVGSGLSRRFFGGPSWDELLGHLARACPIIDRDYAYYKQAIASPLEIGELFAKRYQDWAWSTGRDGFPPELFDESVPANAYIKHKIAEHLAAMTPAKLEAVTDPGLARELSALRAIRPHAIITTNYDRFLEMAFPDYLPVIGQQIIRGSTLSVGELFKIHGCVSQPQSLVITKSDYDEFMRKKKYLSAKLLTYFSEHPLVLIGYGAGDPNIQAIFSDIDEALPVAGGVIPNVYMLEWDPDIRPSKSPIRERLIAIEGNKAIRIKAIQTADFAWVFDAFGATHTHPQVSPKVLRTLLVRSYELVRTDIPRKTVQADFQMLERAVENQENFAKLFGIATVSDPSVISARYPYILSDIGKQLGYKGWNQVQPLLERVKAEKGLDIKRGDNRYHCAVKYGSRAVVHKYSDDAVTLLKKVRDHKPYEI